MSRSLRIHQDHIARVKLSVKRNGYPRQKDLADDLDMSLATISNFLNGKPVDHLNFEEISERIGLSWKEIVTFDEVCNQNKSTFSSENSTIVNLNPYSDLEEGFIYIERPPIESLCYEALLQSGCLLRIKSPSRMGKTSLMAKVFSQIENQNYKTAYLNLHLADTQDFSSLDAFLRWFCISVGQSLGIPNHLASYWDDRFSTSKVNCTSYFEEYLLSKVSNPLILCLDEVDRIFPYSEIASDFLGLLRAWHEQAKVRSIWKKLRLVIVHSTEIYIPLNVNESPFNVGKVIELPELTFAQITTLAQSHGLEWHESELAQLMEIVGGHPYLLQQAFSHFKINGNNSFDRFLHTAATEAGIYRSELRRHWCAIQQNPELAEALRKVVNSDVEVRLDSQQAYKLYSMGIVRLHGNEVKFRCKLYRQYFQNCLKVS
jgi:transcriptional regulator with XRE-family HTH domain